MANAIQELTGDWIHLLENCDDIQAADRYFYNEVVYFGMKLDIEEGEVYSPKVKRSKAWDLVVLSMADRYSFDE